MSRRRYPSDHRPYFRVLESILDDDKLNKLSLSDQGLFFRLLAVLNRQGSVDGKAFIDQFTACALARRERWVHARSAFDRLVVGGLLTARYRDGGVEYLSRKWPEIQGFTPAELRRDSGETPSLRGEERRVEEKREEVREEHPLADSGVAAEAAAAPWMRLMNYVRGGDPPAEEDERRAFIESGVGEQVHLAGIAETPRAKDEPEREHRDRVNATRLRIVSARWHAYLKGPREFRGIAARKARDAEIRARIASMNTAVLDDQGLTERERAGLLERERAN